MDTRSGPTDVFRRPFDVDEHYIAECRDRAITLERDPGRCQVLPHMMLAQWDTLELLMENLSADYPEHFSLVKEGDDFGSRWTWTNRPLGIEQSFEKQLHGITGVEQVETSAGGRAVRKLASHPATPGNTVQLSIDIKLQKLVEDMYGDRRGALVAIDPNTGEVLAFVSKPTFDPNLFVDGIDQDSWATSPVLLRCDLCGGVHTVPPNDGERWLGVSCLRYRCPGRYRAEQPHDADYYRRFYRQGHPRRVYGHRVRHRRARRAVRIGQAQRTAGRSALGAQFDGTLADRQQHRVAFDDGAGAPGPGWLPPHGNQCHTLRAGRGLAPRRHDAQQLESAVPGVFLLVIGHSHRAQHTGQVATLRHARGSGLRRGRQALRTDEELEPPEETADGHQGPHHER